MIKSYLHDINKSQHETLVLFKDKLIVEEILNNFDSFKEDYLLRFLRARKFDLDATMKMFIDFINWRSEFKTDDIEVNFKLM